MQRYLIEYHSKDIENILKAPAKQSKFEILLDLTLVQHHEVKLFEKLLQNYEKQSIRWCQAAVNIQNDLVKTNALFNKELIKSNIEIKPCNHPKIDNDFKICPDKNLFKLVAFRGMYR